MMASGKTSPQDRLSHLPDGVLGHVLSFLHVKEAARAATLARRYRHAFAGVDAISFVEQVAHYGGEDYTFCVEATERRSKNGDFIDSVNAALLCRRRCAGCAAPPRSFRVHFGCLDEWDEAMLSQWLSYLLKRGSKQQELHLDLRLQLTVLDDHQVGVPQYGHTGAAYAAAECRAHSSYEAHPYNLPTRLFSCVGLRTLCLGGCSLHPPEHINLPSLETLLLSSIPFGALGCGDTIQRLISACLCLVDLTLERCGYKRTSHDWRYTRSDVETSYTITVLDKPLRRLALRCCHHLVRVSVDASELRAFEYRGAVPAESFLALHGAHKISSCTISFCGKMVCEEELPRFRRFLEQFTGTTRHLHLVSTHLGTDVENEAFAGQFPSFPALTHLQLTGYLQGGSIKALTRILEQAPSTEILTMFLKPGAEERFYSIWPEWRELGDEFNVSDVSIPCLRNRVREINLVHYQGYETHRYAAKLLLGNAAVLERVCVVLPSGPRASQMKLKSEIQGWVVNTSAKTIFF